MPSPKRDRNYGSKTKTPPFLRALNANDVCRRVAIMSTSTFERMMENEQWKAEFEKGYEEFLISEFLCQQMEHSNLSVRELASRAGVSPSTVQQIRTGKAENVRAKAPMSILHELGCSPCPVITTKALQ